MLNFPVPYPDELIYSVVARAGTHMGITSPKQLLDDVFASRLVIATVDLPNHLDRLRSLYPVQSGYSIEQLAYEHTLFPVYAPFTIEARRQQCLRKMAANSQGAIHLMLGIAASRIKQSKFLRYCPCCLQRQISEHGEYYWERKWQIVGADSCLEHGQLIDASIERHSYHRHQFFSAAPIVCPMLPQSPGDRSAIKVMQQIVGLLRFRGNSVATFAQWGTYYQQLADQGGCLKGHHVRYDDVKERILERWPLHWLNSHGLAMDETDISWLHTIFRKHRKSFSYLEHIVALDAFLPDSWQINDVLTEVSRIRTRPSVPVTVSATFNESSSEQKANARTAWMNLLEQNSVKQARFENGGLYAWLYRHDKEWLLLANRPFYLATARENRRIDWSQRDLLICRQLIKIRNSYKTLLDSPRWSRNWYLSKLAHSASVEKNIHKLPLTSLFFKRYCEDISDYQIRRISKALSCLETEGIQRWRLLRVAGLSDVRLTNHARYMLHEIVGD